MRSMLLACIADDLTGATDLGVNLAREGLSVIQLNGVPAPGLGPAGRRCRRRTEVADRACRGTRSRNPSPRMQWLAARGATRFYFKYCSTFDSTADGNIGPVTEALQRSARRIAGARHPRLSAQPAHRVPRPPVRRRPACSRRPACATHPLTPMTDANLVRLLAAQARRPVGLITADTDRRGCGRRRNSHGIRSSPNRQRPCDRRRDADEHLVATAGRAFAGLPLTTGGAGLAVGLARALHVRRAWQRPARGCARPPLPELAWRSGSCSEATRRASLARRLRPHHPGRRLDPLALARRCGVAARIAAEAVARLARRDRADLIADRRTRETSRPRRRPSASRMLRH